MIFTFVVIKMLIFTALMPPKEYEKWKQDILRLKGLKKKDILKVEGTATQMYIVGVLLYDTCMDYLFDKLGQVKGNIEQIPFNKQPLPHELMFYHPKDTLIPMLNIRFDRLELINEEPVNLDYDPSKPWDLFNRIPMYLFELIKNMEQF